MLGHSIDMNLQLSCDNRCHFLQLSFVRVPTEIQKHNYGMIFP